MSPLCNRDLIASEIGLSHHRDVADTPKIDVKVTAAGKSGNVWYSIELPAPMVTALVTVLEELANITQLRIEVRR